MLKITKRKKKFNEKKEKLKELEALHAELQFYDPTSNEYQTILSRIEDLHKLDKPKVKPDTVVSGLFSLGTVVGIMFYEGAGNVIKTQALKFVNKIKL